MRRHNIKSINNITTVCCVVIGLMMVVSSCGTQKSVVNTPATPMLTFSMEEHLNTVAANKSTQKNLTAKVKVEASVDGKTVRTNGTLRMKRDDVIQLSLSDPLFGAVEMGRMEFTKTRVLIIDKVNRQYVDVPYSDVSFLKKANIDFYTLQALFWNEVFEPGSKSLKPSDFTFEDKVNIIDLSYNDRLLTYRFSTQRDGGLLTQTEITGVEDKAYKFDFTYNGWQNFAGKQFPAQMTMSFVMNGQTTSLSLDLSSLRNSSDWVSRSTVSDKYTKADPERIFKMIVK